MSDNELAQLLCHHLKQSRTGDKANVSRLCMIFSEALQLHSIDSSCHVQSECTGDSVQEGCEQQNTARPIGPLGVLCEAVKGEPSCNLCNDGLGKAAEDVSSVVVGSCAQNVGESSRQQQEQLEDMLRRGIVQYDVDSEMVDAPIAVDDVGVVQGSVSEVQSASVQSFNDGLPQRQPVYQRTSFDGVEALV